MEIQLKQKEIPIWIEEEPILKRSQISMEAVIPDSREDAARVVWTQGGVLLKGKEPGAQGCSVSGELWASVLYLTESGKLDSLRLSREFSLDFEAPQPEAEALPQISWRLTALEGRLLNPRKLGVGAELKALLRPFRRGSLALDADLPESGEKGLHLLQEQKQCLALREVREKSFSLREQLSPQPGNPAPVTIQGEELRVLELSSEQLGKRCILRGEMELRIWGPDGDEMPVSARFRLPFSQLVDLDTEAEALILAELQPSSLYLEWTESIAGERSLDAELHGVVQLRVYSTETVLMAADAYSTRAAYTLHTENRSLLASLERSSASLRAEESLPMPEDFAALLAAEPRLGPLESDREGLSLPLAADLLYRKTDGTADAVRRSLRLQGRPLPEGARPLSVLLQSFVPESADGKLLLRCEAVLGWERQRREESCPLRSIELGEERLAGGDKCTWSLVRPAGESLWELAKEFRSSVEAISACNPEGAELLLIPAE